MANPIRVLSMTPAAIRSRRRRANETNDQASARREAERLRHQVRNNNLTPNVKHGRTVRFNANRISARTRRANESE